MTRTKKTVFAAILSMLVIAIGLAVFFVFPTSAASSGTCGATANAGGAESVSWTLDDSGVLTISVSEGSAGGAMADYSYNGAPWYDSRSSIKEIVVGDGITNIGKYAFYNCTAVTSATFGESVTSIGECAFQNCTRLTTVTFNGNVTSIGKSAFNSCSVLSTVSFGGVAATAEALVIPESVTSIGMNAFFGTLFTSADLTATSLDKLPQGIFYECSTLKRIDLPQEMKSIGAQAFEECYALAILQWEGGTTATEGVIEIPEGVTLGIGAFTRCTAVKEVILPSNLTEIPESLFYGCDQMEKITFKGGITAIGEDAFRNAEACEYVDFNGTVSTNGNLVLPATLKTIGTYAFYGNKCMKSVIIPEGVTSIESSAFRYCTNLEKATFYSTGATVGTNAFMNCSATFSVELPYLCTNAEAAKMKEVLITSGVLAGSVKLDHPDADNDGCCDVTTCYDSKEYGYIIVSGGVKDVDYTYSGGLLTVRKNGTYTLSSSLSETAIEESIVVSAGLDNVTLILNGLNILTTDASNAILVDSSEELPTKVTITLAKDSVNTLKSGVGSALVGGDRAVVTINGEGSLTATGGNNTSTDSKTGGGAGIEMYSEAVLIIDSGTVTANGGNGYNGGPGIGVSRTGDTRSVYIINGGTVTANGGATTRGKSYNAYNGPGFGGSRVLNSSNVYSGGAYVVNGGTLVATGGIYEGAAESTRGAGIGNYCRQVQLISGTVTATGGSTLGDIYMYSSSSSSVTDPYYYSYWNTVDSLTLANDKVNLGTKVRSAVINHEAKTITIPSIESQYSYYLEHSSYFCFYGDLVIPDEYTLTGYGLTLCYNSSLTVSEGAFVDDSFTTFEGIFYSKGMKFAKWLCPYEGVRTDEDLSSHPHGTNVTGEEYAKIYSTFSIKSIYYDRSSNTRADLKPLTETCTDLPITIDFEVISLDESVVFVEGYDYTLTYNNNIWPGTASYTITPLEGGRMIGDPVTVEFTIIARALAINAPTTAHMQVGGNALDVLPKGASAIYLMIDQTPQEIQNGKFTWYVDAERTTLLTKEYGAALAAGEHTVYWTYHHEHKGFENDLTGVTTLYVTEKAPQQIEIDGVGVIDGVIPLFNKGGVTTTTVKFDLHSVITVNGEPITDVGELTWTVNGIAPVNGVSTYVLDDDGSVSVDQNGLLTIVGMSTHTVTVTLTAAETESYAGGSGQITVEIHPAAFHLRLGGSVGDTGGDTGGSSGSGPQTITISGVTVDHKIYDGVAVSYKGTPTATLSDGTPVTLPGQYTFTYYKQTGTDEGDALDYTPYAVGNYWLIITYSDANYKGEYKTEFIIAHREIHVQPDGTLQSGTLLDGHTVADVVTDAKTGAITRVVIKNADGDDVSANYLVIFAVTETAHEHDFSESVRCSGCGELAPLRFYGWSLTLQDNIALNYAVDAKFFADGCYKNPSVTFTIDGRTVTVTDYNTEKYAGYYIFTLTDIAPYQMGETVSATLTAYDGENPVTTDAAEYSIKTYCYNKLNDETSSAELKKLIVDLLNYGAATQTYVGSTDALVNADLTEEQKAYGTQEDAELATHAKDDYQTVENASATWVGAYLTLTDAVEMKFVFSADSTDGLQVKVTTADPADAQATGQTWIITEFTKYSEGAYIANFDGFNADQMSEVVYVTVCDSEGNAVSNTYRYSVESYAYAKQSDENTNLVALVKAMMKYGDSAKQYNS